jgi:hypothetical protein
MLVLPGARTAPVKPAFQATSVVLVQALVVPVPRAGLATPLLVATSAQTCARLGTSAPRLLQVHGPALSASSLHRRGPSRARCALRLVVPIVRWGPPKQRAWFAPLASAVLVDLAHATAPLQSSPRASSRPLLFACLSRLGALWPLACTAVCGKEIRLPPTAVTVGVTPPPPPAGGTT